MKKFIMALDNGTTGTTSALIDANSFELIDKYNEEYPQHYPKPGMVEHDLNEIWLSVKSTVSKLLTKNSISPDQIISIGITNQRETSTAFDKKGNPLCKAIVWQDRRTGEFCQKLKDMGKEKIVKELTGLPLDPYFSATKFKWFLDNSESVKKCAQKNDLCLGTIDTYLVYQLTGQQSFVTEPSNASRTLLMNLNSCDWDKELLSLFDIKREFLPEIKNSFDNFGVTKNLGFLPDGIPITGILGDQQAALFGQACLHPGDIKSTYGTGAFLLMNTGHKIKFSSNGLLTTVAYKNNTNVTYALEGSVYVAGAAVQFLRDQFHFFSRAIDIEAMAISSKDTSMEHLLFLPFLTGIGTPYWVSEAKGALIGMTRDTSKNDVARACLEGIALSLNDCITSFSKDFGSAPSEIKVDGGASMNNFLMDAQATISNVKIIRPGVIETTVYGAALASAVGKGVIKIDQIPSLWKSERSFTPNRNMTEYYSNKKYQWNSLIKKLYL